MPRLNRFYLADDLVGSELFINDQELVNQLKNVLRLKSGEIISLFNGAGREVLATIGDFTENAISLIVKEERKMLVPLAREATLYLAILKKENFEWAAQKATEVGVTEICPIITERTIKQGLRFDRLEKIVKEAAEQCGRRTLPKILPVINLTEVVASLTDGIKIFFDQDGKEFFSDSLLTDGHASIFVGPEGGWSSTEKLLMTEKGILAVSLGPLILRAETAATIAVYLLTKKG